ncbi:hypothetical protein H0V99_03730 [Candidatus Saccharibacteria bacterium]|nr:hypothetical protein [Candidatus Saccharibacteria bacterium]
MGEKAEFPKEMYYPEEIKEYQAIVDERIASGAPTWIEEGIGDNEGRILYFFKNKDLQGCIAQLNESRKCEVYRTIVRDDSIIRESLSEEQVVFEEAVRLLQDAIAA